MVEAMVDQKVKYEIPAGDESIENVSRNLGKNGVKVIVVETAGEARRLVLESMPGGSQVMNATSATLQEIGLDMDINESGRFDSVRKRLEDDKTQAKQKKYLGTAPDWVVGSVHAITEDGHVIVVSNTGSQLPAYIYGAEHVLWVAGTHKIVADIDEGMKRINEYTFPLEDKRAMKAYGVHSGINKVFIFNKEIVPGRITLFLVRQKLGF